MVDEQRIPSNRALSALKQMEDSAASNSVCRIAVLHSRLSGYMAACHRKLKELYNVELLVFYWPTSKESPFEEAIYRHIDHSYERTEWSSKQIAAIVSDFDPQAILMAGWSDSGYLEVAKWMKKQGIPVISNLDRQWRGSIRQQIGRLIAPWYLWPAIDVFWVPGERQWEYAKRLGYTGARCWFGMYACDWDSFAHFNSKRSLPELDGEKAFLFVGRYAAEKGLDTLIEAFKLYRDEVEKPWSLVCAGSGEQQVLLEGEEGVINVGFIQPDNLPQLFHQASAFVLPSRKEPWGVVVQEAAASSLPLICSDACGAAVHLLQDGYNGYRFEVNNAEDLSRCMIHMTERTQSERKEMGSRSFELSKQFTPTRWAHTLMRGLAGLKERRKNKR